MPEGFSHRLSFFAKFYRFHGLYGLQWQIAITLCDRVRACENSWRS